MFDLLKKIDNTNVCIFHSTNYNNIDLMKWDHEDYIEWKNNGFPINLEVTDLDISWYDITTLEGLNNLTNLQILDCSHNQIESLDGISNLTNLQELYCDYNQIKSLEGISKLANLQILDCSHNQIESLEGISNLTNLRELYCGCNQIESLEGMNNLINLQLLCCHSNKIKTLNGMNNLINLCELYCHYNLIKSLEGILNLHNLQELSYWNNLIEYIPPNIVRLLHKIKHDYYISDNISECFRQSIQSVLNVKPPNTNIYELIVNDNILTQQTKEILINYSNDKVVHSALNITFEELLIHVFGLIESNSNSEEIKAVLNIEMNDSLNRCFTTKMSRLMNCLN